MGWKQYFFSIITCSFLCSTVLQIAAGEKNKRIIRLICGSLLAISILYPMGKRNPEDWLRIPVSDCKEAEYCVISGEEIASRQQASCIKAACESYILKKAQMLGATITAEVSLNEEQIPAAVGITGEGSRNVQMELQEILHSELGIPKENQTWIWNRESSISLPP